ncbi:pleckstrin homology domain-containing family A member 6 isoform X9 [Cololabis saira]|uniref:pleckstrin homology domain-containing family A member 6 isoform X9 n=1 Tax=Cololabis saira TaxID=129043 RepID=UPI002AD36780|nr:pleckstrin homology domain-containing family A member 6 isoform X9 [Cololabis saira]
MLKFRVDRRVSHDPRGGVGAALTCITLDESSLLPHPLQRFGLDMKLNAAAEKISYSNSQSMVSDLSAEAQTHTWMSRTPRKTASFGKRSNSMRRNPKAEVTKRGWMYKQASSGVKQWNKRWFVLTDRCLFYYKDEKEDGVLGSLPLLSFRIGAVEPVDNITRRFAFKVWSEEEEEEEEGQDGQLKAPVVSCLQAKHAGTRTYYFSADSHEDQQDWIRTMREAAEVTEQTHRIKLDTADDLKTTGTTRTDPQTQTHNGPDGDPPHNPKMNGVGCPDTSPLTTPSSDHEAKRSIRRRGDVAEADQTEGGMPAGTVPHSNHHPDGWVTGGPPHSKSQTSNGNPPVFGKYSEGQGQREVGGGQSHDHKDPQENVVLRRGFVPRTTPERVAQRKSSMAQLQQWVNQRRVMNSQEDLNSPSHYYSVHRGVSADFYRHSVGSQYGDEYPLYQPGVRPDSICSVSAVGGYDPHWTVERRSLRDGPPQPRDPWGPQQYAGMEKSMRRLSIQPRSRSVPRSPSLSSGGHYSPVPPNFASPARSPSTYFDRFSGRMRDDVIYADPFAYSLRRSISSPKYVYPGDRRSFSHGLYQHSYPVSPSIHMKADEILDLQLQRNLEYLDQQIPPFHDVYSRELHPTLKLNEIETSKLLGRLCEQSRILRDHEAVVHRLRMEKDSLEEELVAIHQEMELYQNQPSILENLQFKKETQQNQLINIRGELSQASSALATVRMEFDALEDEAHAIHGDLWEQLNAGGQPKTGEQSRMKDVQDQDKHTTMNKVGIVPPRTKSPAEEFPKNSAEVLRHISRERPKSAVFPADVKSKMSVEEQNERIRRNQSSSMRDKRRSLNLSGVQIPASYKVVRRRLTAHEIDIKDLEAAVRGEGQESPWEEITRLRQLEQYDISRQLAPEKLVIPERYMNLEQDTPLSPEEQKEKQRKLDRIKTLIAKSNLQNMVPLLDGPVEGGASAASQQHLQEQEKRIEISCALAAEASRRSRLLSAQCASSPPTSPTSLVPTPSSADFPNSAHIMKV